MFEKTTESDKAGTERLGTMPNGGSDCCGTCWFNRKNKGEEQASYHRSHDPGPDYCVIRDLAIEDPFYTYCANHPHRNPRKLSLPIGPVFVGDSLGRRERWKPSLDNEEIRLQLLELLKRRAERKEPPLEYHAGFYLDEVLIVQLAEFKEERAIEDLKRLAALDTKPSPHPIFRDNRRTVIAAKIALQVITEDKDDVGC